MSNKSDNEVEVEAEPSPKRQKTSGDEAEAAEPKATPDKKQDEAADGDGEAKPAADKDDKSESEGEDKGGEGRKRKLGGVKNDAEEMVSKLMERPLAKKADVRGRRLLGAMMGHLVSAKSRLKDEGLLDPTKRRALESKPDRQAQERETEYLERRLERHYTAMKNFIRTRAEPTIFYLPKKHTQKTQSRLDETRDAVEQKIKALKVHLRVTSYDPLEAKQEEDEEKSDKKNGKAEDADGKSEDKKEEEKKAADSSEDESAPEDKTADAARAKAAKAAEEEQAERKKSKSKSRSPSAASAKSAASAASAASSR